MIINPLKNKTRYGWHFEQQVYDPNGITRAVKAGGGSGNIPKIIEYESNSDREHGKTEGKGRKPTRGRVYSPDGIAPTLLATMATKIPKVIVYEFKIDKVT